MANDEDDPMENKDESPKKNVDSAEERKVALGRFKQHIAVCPDCSSFGVSLCAEGMKLRDLAERP
jgi:hypothetical protein